MPSSPHAKPTCRWNWSVEQGVCLLLVLAWAIPGQRATSADGAEKQLLAGAATSNITPPLDLPIVGGWGSPLAQHVHDELWARCLVLDNGEKRVGLVIIDNIGAGREVYDAARSMLREQGAIPPENLIMAGTHTHSSVSARGPNRLINDGSLSEYQQFLARRIADGVRRAVNNLQPARIGWGSASEPTQVFNRRYFMKPGTPTLNPFGGQDQVVMNPGQGNPNLARAAGPTDPEIAFLSVQSIDGKPLALLANYSLHYVGPSAGSVISADYFGAFADRIQQLMDADRQDPPFVGMLSNGSSADINNIDWLNKPERRWAPYEKMRDVADRVARAVVEAHQQVEFHSWIPLDATFAELTLAVRNPDEQQIAFASAVLAKPEDEKPNHGRERVYAERVLQLAESPSSIRAPLYALRIGDVGVCAIPFEVFAEIGLQIKAESPLPRAFTISHANGTYGYLPTAAQHELGGYETWLGTSVVEYEAASKITETLLGMLKAMK